MDDFSDFNPSASTKSNVPELSVSELALSLKRTLEDTYGRVRVRGELSRVKIHSSGHLYSDLKDADAVLNIVCWRGNVARLSVKPEEGLDVVCTGKITSYPARSNYQMVVETMELAGEGALLKMLEDRRKRLAAEGLFDETRKKPRPFLPEVIGVITSPTGAVIRDILHRLEDRFPRRVLLWPVNVQGETAAAEITAAIQGMNNLDGTHPDFPRPDLLIVARGGGSLEDLMPFNEENVVRAAAQSSIPLISAVGHETDTTLIDYAADLRAPTPTAAAELAVPERVLLQSGLNEMSGRLNGFVQTFIKGFVQHLGHLSARLGDPARLFETREQKLDHMSDRLSSALSGMISRKDQVFSRLSGRLPHPRQRLDLAQKGLEHASQGLVRSGAKLFQDSDLKVSHAAKMLELLSFKSVLGRGFAVLRNESGKPVTCAGDVSVQDSLTVELQDGSFKTIVEEKL